MPNENLAGRTIAGYRLLERVGEGGTADVYRAEHPEHGHCAFKVLRQRLRGDPTAVKRFLREAGYGSRVRHPGVVRTYDFGEADGLNYLALEWAEGQSLAQFLHHNGPLAPDFAADLVGQLADGLAAAHAAGIVHRDLKPENVYLVPDDDGEIAKVLDFGVAKWTSDWAVNSVTKTGLLVGTPLYMSPEQARGTKEIGEQGHALKICRLGAPLTTAEQKKKEKDKTKKTKKKAITKNGKKDPFYENKHRPPAAQPTQPSNEKKEVVDDKKESPAPTKEKNRYEVFDTEIVVNFDDSVEKVWDQDGRELSCEEIKQLPDYNK